MRPELFRVLEVAFPAYFLLLLSGFVFATAMGAIWARRIGQDPDVIVDLGLACLLMGVIGGRLMHVIADGYFWDYVHLCTDPSQVDWRVEQALCVPKYKGVWDAAKGVCHPTQSDCFAWAKFWAGGLTYYGGLIGASVAAVYLLKRDRFPFWKAADMAGFAVPLGLGFGRVGCLLAGCCFGFRTDGAMGMSFPPHSPASEAQFKLGQLPSVRQWSEEVHPTQIYESAMSFGIAAFCLLWVHGRKRYDGQVFATFLGLYAAGRFALEFARADDRGGLLGLSTSQLLGIGLVGVAIAIHQRRNAAGAAPAPARSAPPGSASASGAARSAEPEGDEGGGDRDARREAAELADADLDALARAFAAYRRDPEGGYRDYFAAVRRHHIRVEDMARQAPYFERYADEVLRQVKRAPSLKGTGAMTYFRYLAQDLSDCGVEALVIRGERLADALDED